jgi:hypothetical protein
MKFCPAIGYDLFILGPLIRVLGGVKVEKVKILTKSLKMVFNRQFWVLLIGKRPKMMGTNISV